MKDYVTLDRVDPFYTVHFPDKTHVSHWSDWERFLKDVETISPSDLRGVEQFFEHSERIFSEGFLNLGDKQFTGLLDMLKAAPSLLNLKVVQSVYSLTSKYVKDEKLRQLLSFHPLLIGGNPFAAPAVYCLINVLERIWGVWHARGGMGALCEAILKRYEEIGGQKLLACEAKEIHREENEFRIHTSKGLIRARKLIVGGDIPKFCQTVLKGKAKPSFLSFRSQHFKLSMSAFLVYLGCNRQWPELGQHHIVLGPRYKGLIEDIFKGPKLAEDFSYYLHLPTRTDKSLAPSGHEVVYALVPVPNLDTVKLQDTDYQRLEQALLQDLEERLLPGLRASIQEKARFSPHQFESVLKSQGGNAFALEPRLIQSASFRPTNRSREVEGLYFVGAGTQPGAGIPGVLTSARITIQSLLEDLGRSGLPKIAQLSAFSAEELRNSWKSSGAAPYASI